MSQSLKQLEKQFQRVAQLDHALTFLQWDQMVMMPDGGVEARSAAIAELAAMRHDLLTSPMTGDALAEVIQELASGSFEHSKQRHIREMERAWQQAGALPASLVRAQVLASSRCEHEWRTQKKQNDWPGFLNNFREVLALSREEAQCRQAQEPERFSTPYDAMLDLHCCGDSRELIDAVFAELRQALPGLLQLVMQKQAAADSPPALHGHYPIEQQRQLSRRLMSVLGFDFNSGRLDESAHPFSTGGPGDQRITTRYRDTDFADALQATAHETGHASYEAGLPVLWRGYPVGQARNMSIHESQSLYFEKHVYLSRSMTGALMPHVHECLPASRAFSARQLWDAQTRVAPSYIRVEADEVTYPLHVMLRYDIESALINEQMQADDIPEAWNQAMSDYLGLDVADDHARGCLQDIHWTDGTFGYFPSYTMGAVNAAQLSAVIRQHHPDWAERFAAGDTGFARQWLAEHIWSQASHQHSQELMIAASDEPTNAKRLLEHLEQRYLHEFD